MAERPGVSVVVPAYDAEATVEAAVRSALGQTLPPLEVLVVDDGSRDATAEVLQRLAGQDARVRLLGDGVNRGVAAARNRALDAARGEWVALLDADDRWLPGRLSALMCAADAADVVSDDLLLDREADARSRRSWHGTYLARAAPGLRCPCWVDLARFLELDLGLLQPVVRRRFLERNRLRYDVALTEAEDFDFAVRLLRSGARWRQLCDAHYVYTLRDGSLSASRSAVPARHVALAEAYLRDPSLTGRADVARALRRHLRRSRAAVVYAELVRRRQDEGWPSALAYGARPGAAVLLAEKAVQRAQREAAVRHQRVRSSLRGRR